MVNITGTKEEVFQGVPETDQARGILLNAEDIEFQPLQKSALQRRINHTVFPAAVAVSEINLMFGESITISFNFVLEPGCHRHGIAGERIRHSFLYLKEIRMGSGKIPV